MASLLRLCRHNQFTEYSVCYRYLKATPFKRSLKRCHSFKILNWVTISKFLRERRSQVRLTSAHGRLRALLTFVISAIDSHAVRRLHPSGRKTMDVLEHTRHLPTPSVQFAYLPTQSSVLHRFRHLVRLYSHSSRSCIAHFVSLLLRGLIGPSRQFGIHSIYYPQVYAVIVGAFLPIPLWWWQRKRPNDWNKYLSTPIMLNAITYVPPATGINYSSWISVAFVFQYWIRRKHLAWWAKFNYVTSAALDIGK